MTPRLENEEFVQYIANKARKNHPDLAKIKRHLTKHPDFVNGATYPDTDIDIGAALIMRFLHDNIFQKVLYGAIPEIVEAITLVDTSMQTNLEPKRGALIVACFFMAIADLKSCRPLHHENLVGRGVLSCHCPSGISSGASEIHPEIHHAIGGDPEDLLSRRREWLE